jgi:predicted RNA-binding protein YlqC (UPF0109 family)
MANLEISDQEFVENIVKALVDNPEDVITTRTLDERGVLIQLTVNQADMGKVIGREGKTAKAIRALLRVFGARNDSRINLKIVEPDGQEVHVPEDGAVAVKEEKAAKPVEKAEETEKATSVI